MRCVWVDGWVVASDGKTFGYNRLDTSSFLFAVEFHTVMPQRPRIFSKKMAAQEAAGQHPGCSTRTMTTWV